jgi:AcrR family transcriptional regulator
VTDRRQQILRAAEQVFAENGYAQSSITAIATAAGVTRPTIYSYFESKYEILEVIAEQVRDEILHAQERASGNPVTILQETTRLGLHQWVKHLDVLTVIEHEALSDPQFARLIEDVTARSGHRHRQFIDRLTADGLADPLVSPEEIDLIYTGTKIRLAQVVTREPEREEECAGILFRALKALINFRE